MIFYATYICNIGNSPVFPFVLQNPRAIFTVILPYIPSRATHRREISQSSSVGLETRAGIFLATPRNWKGHDSRIAQAGI